MREYGIPKNLDHPHIMKFELIRFEGDLALRMDMASSTLQKLISNCYDVRYRIIRRLHPKAVLQAITDIMDAISFAHQHRVLHRDLKPDNVLVFPSGLRVSDFGLCRFESHQMTANRGTPGYIAPEVLSSSVVTDYSFPADVYSCGKILHQLLLVMHPDASATSTAIKEKLSTLCGEMIQNAPQARPTAEDCLRRLCNLEDGVNLSNRLLTNLDAAYDKKVEEYNQLRERLAQLELEIAEIETRKDTVQRTVDNYFWRA
tara:strand:- start:342 stop:1118 length:777 start_codon:yes stop_codon:yes gene_type:complete